VSNDQRPKFLADNFRVVTRDSPLAMLGLIRAKHEIINRLASLVATNQFIWIEGLTDGVLDES
jgi:hypothetical protein